MSNREKLEKIETILEGYTTPSVKRAAFIAAAATVGLKEKDTYPVLKEWTKDSKRGHYVVAAMLRQCKQTLGKTINIKPRPVSQKIKDRAGQGAEASDWVLPYSDSDVAEELSLMGTHI
jgi:hypothetical protein